MSEAGKDSLKHLSQAQRDSLDYIGDMLVELGKMSLASGLQTIAIPIGNAFLCVDDVRRGTLSPVLRCPVPSPLGTA